MVDLTRLNPIDLVINLTVDFIYRKIKESDNANKESDSKSSNK